MFGAAQARLQAQVFNELATMVRAGVTIGESLSALAQDMEHARVASVLSEMGRAVSAGSSLTEALRHHPGAFSPITISLIEVGETGGLLDRSLAAAAEYHERDFELRHLLTRETFYPIILFAVILFIWPMTHFIITWIQGSFLAALVRLLLELLLMLIYVGLPVGGAVIAYRLYARTEQGRIALDRMILQIPVIGNTVRRLCLARFCRALASLYSAGVLLGRSLRVAAETTGNRALEHELVRGASEVERGGKLSDALAEAPLVPRMLVRMLRTGEDTGDVDSMAHQVADHFEQEAQTAVKQMAVSITPVAVLVAGVIVGIMAISFYTGAFSALINLR